MERVLYNLHLRLCTYALRTSSNRSRSWAERGLLLVSICCFGALYMSHRSFVYRPLMSSRSGNIPLTCLPNIRGFTRHADITHIILLDEFQHQASVSNTATGIEATDGTSLVPPEESSYAYTLRNRTTNDAYCPAMPSKPTSAGPPNVCEEPSRQQIYFSYAKVKGYLLLPHTLILERLTVQYVKVSTRDSRCFGEPFLQEIIFILLSPETVILNWLLGLEDSEAYAYHPRTDTLIDLHPSEERALVLGSQIGSKLYVVLRTCFLFFITTTLVSFTLRETQERMLDFTHQLQNHVRNRQPVVHLVTRHFIDNLVFCPIMVGMIFFLIEFYRGDKALAFLVLSIVWLGEAFSVISLRSTNGLHFFPRIFFLLFSLFHFYLFSFPFGFTHTALACTACFMVHSMLFFWHRYELPAVALGRVSPEHPRMGQPPTQVNTSWQSPDASIPQLLVETETPAQRRDMSHHQQSAAATPLSRFHLTMGTNNNSGNSLSSLSNHPPRFTLQRTHSHISNSSHGNNNNNISRQTSASALYMGEDGDESFVYFLEGEVVMPRQERQRSSHSQQQRIPDHVLAAVDVAPDDTTKTPVRDNLTAARQALGPDHPRTRTAPAFPRIGGSDHSSISSTA